VTQSIDVADFCNRSIQPTAAYLSTHDAFLRMPYCFRLDCSAPFIRMTVTFCDVIERYEEKLHDDEEIEDLLRASRYVSLKFKNRPIIDGNFGNIRKVTNYPTQVTHSSMV